MLEKEGPINAECDSKKAGAFLNVEKKITGIYDVVTVFRSG